MADLAGGVFYAGLVYVLLVFLRPRAARLSNAVLGLALCVGVELLQITSIPTSLAAVFPPIRLVLGTTFVPLDLLAYAIGTAIALGIDALAGKLAGKFSGNTACARSSSATHSS